MEQNTSGRLPCPQKVTEASSNHLPPPTPNLPHSFSPGLCSVGDDPAQKLAPVECHWNCPQKAPCAASACSQTASSVRPCGVSYPKSYTDGDTACCPGGVQPSGEVLPSLIPIALCLKAVTPTSSILPPHSYRPCLVSPHSS